MKMVVACVLAAGLVGAGTGCDEVGSYSGSQNLWPSTNTRSPRTNPAGDDIMDAFTSILSAAASGQTTSHGRYY